MFRNALVITAISLASATGAMAAQSSGSSSSSTYNDGSTVVEAHASGNATASSTAVGTAGTDFAYAIGDGFDADFDLGNVVIEYHVSIESSYDAALDWLFDPSVL